MLLEQINDRLQYVMYATVKNLAPTTGTAMLGIAQISFLFWILVLIPIWLNYFPEELKDEAVGVPFVVALVALSIFGSEAMIRMIIRLTRIMLNKMKL